MNNNYLILGFKNAGLFTNKKSKDKVFDLGITKQRSEVDFYVEPITVNQISNMIHVLFGERPVPSLRSVVYNRVDYLFNKAMESYVRIDSNQKYNKFKDLMEYISETIQVKKGVWNAWNPINLIFWERVKQILEDDYDSFISLLKDEFGLDPESISFEDMRKKIVNSSNENIKNFLINLKGKKCLHNDIYSEISCELNANAKTALLVNRGVEKVIKLSGEILVPISDDDIIKLQNSKGCATILDGGLVYIKGIKSGDTITSDGFRKVSEISLETY